MPVTTERRGPVLVIRLDRPAKRNAMDADMTRGLDAALNLLEDDEQLWAGVLTGAGGSFCAGTDLASGSGPATERGGEYGLARRHRLTPLIGAVEGVALGGGFELALSCDLLVAARTALFGLPEVRRGVVAACGGLFRTPHALPLNIARELLLTGEPMPAERAWSLGLVNVLTEPGDALAGGLELAGRICANSPSAVRATLSALEATTGAGDEAGWAATGSAIDAIESSADAGEGVSAFLDRRPPVWTGR